MSAPTRAAPTSSLKSVAWFAAPPAPSPTGVASTLAKLAVGLAIGALLFLSGRKLFAAAVVGISVLIGAISLASPAARAALDAFFARLGRWIGTAIGTTLLTLVWVLIVTPLRLQRRLTGADQLHLRDADRLSFWLTCDADARKVRHLGAMFVTEAPTPRGRSFLSFLVVTAALLAVAEGILRTEGFGGDAVLYVSDPAIGYYTAPNQKLGRYGGRVETNKFGMRAPDYAAEKAPGTFRILMLGDSTLYGGSYVDQDDLYARILERKLQAHAGATGKVEVLNMGVNGWGPYHERGFLQKFGTFGADLVMICGPAEDLNRPQYGLMSVPFFAVENPPALALEEVFMHLTWRYRRNRTSLSQAWEVEQSIAGMGEYGRMIDELKDKGIEVLLEVIPSRTSAMSAEALNGRDRAEQMRAAKAAGEAMTEFRMLRHEEVWIGQFKVIAKDRKIVMHFPAGHFAGKGTADDLYHDHTHLGVKGHAVYADYLEGAVMTDSMHLRKWLADRRAAAAGGAR